jgi:hypothetical protein
MVLTPGLLHVNLLTIKEVFMAKSDAFAESSKARFEVADASEVKLGLGGTFKAEQVGTLGVDSGNVE